MKCSVCITVFNEQKSIRVLLDSLIFQSKYPAEIVIVDAGSTDKTIRIIKKYKDIKLFIHKGASIAKGRNLAIKFSKYNTIAMTDAGCVCHKDWLENITKPFGNPKTKIVAGFYHMNGNSNFQKALKLFLGTVPDKYDPKTFLPSARSIAFRKSAWKKVGGFCEKFDRAGEDTDFNIKIINHNIEITKVKKALVDWEVPNNISEAFKKFYYYAKGDIQSKRLFTSHNIKVLTVFVRYLVFLTLIIFSLFFPFTLTIFILLFVLYLVWSILKNKNFVKGWKARLWIAIIQLASDQAVMAGFISGVWDILNK